MNTPRLISNILRFEGKPFENPVTAIKYELNGNMNWYDLGWRVRNLRRIRENRFVPIIQEGMELFTTKILSDSGMGLLEELNNPSPTELSTSSDYSLGILTRLVGESVAVSLRNRHMEFWKVEEAPNAVFEVSQAEALDGFGRIAVYKGFQYQPIIMRSGRTGLIIDPRFKFHSTKTLRNLIDERNLGWTRVREDPSLLAREETKRQIVDVCPVDDCPEKTDPFSACRLAGTGRSLYLADFVEEKPSSVEPNLINYHREPTVCPQTPLLAGFILDGPPVGRVERGGREYYYPLERLRERPGFDKLNGDDRSLLMDKVRMKPSDRFALTEYYASRLARIQIEGMRELTVAGFRTEWDETPDRCFQKPTLVVNQDRRTRFPSRDLEKYGPVDLQELKIDKIGLGIIYSETEQIKSVKLLSDVFVKETGTGLLPTFQEYLKRECEVVIQERVTKDNYSDLLALIEQANKNHQWFGVLLLHGSARRNELMKKLTSDLIVRNISKQGVREDGLQKSYTSKRRGYFRNVYLGLYAKLGGQAWALWEKLDPHVLYVGHSSRISGDQYHFSECVYANQGKFIDGVYENCEKEEAVARVIANLNGVAETTEEIVLLIRGRDHKLGYAGLQEIKEHLTCKLSVFEVLDSPLRLYFSKNGRVFIPDLGCSLLLPPSSYVLVTTQMRFGTPNPIVVRGVLGPSDEIEHKVQAIFNLTQCYTGYEKFSLKYPVPVHASARALSKALDMKLDSLKFTGAWFV